MKRLISLALLLSACAIPRASAAQAGSMCGVDVRAQRVVLDAALLYSATGAHRLPQVTPSEVAIVTDSSTCAAAAEARRLQRGESAGTARPLVLVRVGTTHFLLFDTILQPGGRMQLVVTDAAFSPLVHVAH